MKNIKEGEVIFTGNRPYEYGVVELITDDIIVVKDLDTGTDIDCNPEKVHKLPPFLEGKDGTLLKRTLKDGILYSTPTEPGVQLYYDEAIRSGYISKGYNDKISI